MLQDLRHEISSELHRSDGWRLLVNEDDPDGQTLWFEYPSNASTEGYIRPSVKIEIGARSEHWPVSEYKIQSYLKEALKEKVIEPAVSVRVLNAERTFWEKATILHQYAHLPQGKKPPIRLSRHLYDFYCLLNSPVKQKALNEIGLLERVSTHKSIYFASAWANYQTAQKGTLKLSLPTHHLAELERDYRLMKAMFFGKIPEWEQILTDIQEFEAEFNKSNKET
jgi:hypothetical protein